MSRQEVLRLLYTRLKAKSRVLIDQRVSSILTGESGVSVRTVDGANYHGDLVVGADGVHSITRWEMWRAIAEKNVENITENDQSGNCFFHIATNYQIPRLDTC